MSLSTPVYVRLKEDPSMEGLMVSMDIISTPTKNENNEIIMNHSTLCGVCWNDARSPAVFMHPVEQLEWLDVPGFTDSEDDLDDDLDGVEENLENSESEGEPDTENEDEEK